ncbi:MAG: peptidylprolyl isomerase [Treponema sp.]|nr:peptidylprolyl isomerase [Treponema sp.]
MKKQFYTVGSVIVLLFAAFIFVVLPAMVGGAKQNKLPPFGSWNGKPILYEQGTDFSNAVTSYAEMLKMQGQEITDSSYFYIFNYAFNTTAMKMAYEEAVEETGWKPVPSAVNRAMLPYFYDETGKYSARLFKQVSDDEKRELNRQIKSNLTTQRYFDDMFGSAETVGKDALYGLKSSSKEIPFIQKMGSTVRTFKAVAFSTDNYPQEKVLAYGKEHSDLFVKYDFSVITVNDESTAKTVLDRLNKNEIVFTDAVTEYSIKNYTDAQGKINNAYNYQIKNLIADEDSFKAVCNLKSGETSQIVKTSTGYSIFKADSDAVSPDFADETVKSTVASYINTYERGLIEDYFTAIAKDFSAAALQKNFEDACKDFKVEKIDIPEISLNYGNLAVLGTFPVDEIPELSSAATDENFLKTAFSLKQNELSEPVILGKNVVVLQLNEEKTGGTDEATALQTFPAEIKDFDQEAASSALFGSPKLKNNVMSVYFSNFMSNK